MLDSNPALSVLRVNGQLLDHWAGIWRRQCLTSINPWFRATIEFREKFGRRYVNFDWLVSVVRVHLKFCIKLYQRMELLSIWLFECVKLSCCKTFSVIIRLVNSLLNFPRVFTTHFISLKSTKHLTVWYVLYCTWIIFICRILWFRTRSWMRTYSEIVKEWNYLYSSQNRSHLKSINNLVIIYVYEVHWMKVHLMSETARCR